MKALKRLNIKDKPGYYFINVTNIEEFGPEFLLFNNLPLLTICQLCLMLIIVKKITHHMLVLIT